MTAAAALLAFVTLERLAELWLARRNTAALLARGAVEVAPEHYPAIVALHAAWLVGLWGLGWDQPVDPVWLTVFLLLQVLRAWVLVTLKDRWTTRIIILRAPLVTTGPYRFVSHPNYMVVIGEIAALPLALGLPGFALLFSIANAAVLSVRIRAESAALNGGSNSLPLAD
ncbi:MAG: isoprenylcysteine carboxylmethyltransferase family protein, partial [Ancalomicrobiaceae bacterium]|nr:isoprenylcysteine carboxylmethyltransferase family protein [Ancalomicrobiaceae bacterium]